MGYIGEEKHFNYVRGRGRGRDMKEDGEETEESRYKTEIHCSLIK